MSTKNKQIDMFESADTLEWVEWIITERHKRNWSQAELARRAKLTRNAINQYEMRRRLTPNVQALSRISVAFGYPSDLLPRIAGIIPPLTEQTEEGEKAAFLVDSMQSKETKAQAIDYLRFLLEREKTGKRN